MSKKELNTDHVQYLDTLDSWVANTFGNYETFEAYRVAFNQFFGEFQFDTAKKLDLESMSSGFMSCSLAALITGLWWVQQKDTEPEYLVDLDEQGMIRKSQQHIHVALPLIKSLANLEFRSKLYSPEMSHWLLIAEYVHSENVEKIHKNGLRVTPIHRIPNHYYRITGTNNFFLNRCEVFKFKPESPSQPTES